MSAAVIPSGSIVLSLPPRRRVVDPAAVAAICSELGPLATQRRVREILGGGSFRDVCRAMRQWRASLEGAAAAPVPADATARIAAIEQRIATLAQAQRERDEALGRTLARIERAIDDSQPLDGVERILLRIEALRREVADGYERLGDQRTDESTQAPSSESDRILSEVRDTVNRLERSLRDTALTERRELGAAAATLESTLADLASSTAARDEHLARAHEAQREVLRSSIDEAVLPAIAALATEFKAQAHPLEPILPALESLAPALRAIELALLQPAADPRVSRVLHSTTDALAALVPALAGIERVLALPPPPDRGRARSLRAPAARREAGGAQARRARRRASA